MTEKIYARATHIYLNPERIRKLDSIRREEESDQDIIYRLIDAQDDDAFPQASDHIHVEKE